MLILFLTQPPSFAALHAVYFGDCDSLFALVLSHSLARSPRAKPGSSRSSSRAPRTHTDFGDGAPAQPCG